MRLARVRAAVIAATLVAAAGSTPPLRAQPARPDVVPRLDLAALEGAWFEVASTGTWTLRRCDADTRHLLERRGARALRVVSTCTAGGRVERRRGLIDGRHSDGRLSIRYAPIVLAWLPAAWADFWVLALAEADGWLLVGDRQRRALAIYSRTIAPAESALAQAMAAARAQGYDVGRLRRVPQLAGPGELGTR